MKLLKLNVDDIKPNPFQPREKFEKEITKIKMKLESIKKKVK